LSFLFSHELSMRIPLESRASYSGLFWLQMASIFLSPLWADAWPRAFRPRHFRPERSRPFSSSLLRTEEQREDFDRQTSEKAPMDRRHSASGPRERHPRILRRCDGSLGKRSFLSAALKFYPALLHRVFHAPTLQKPVLIIRFQSR